MSSREADKATEAKQFLGSNAAQAQAQGFAVGGALAQAPILSFPEREAFQIVEGLEGPFDLRVEEYREYDSPAGVYRITDPVSLYFRRGGRLQRLAGQGLEHGPRGAGR